MGIPRFYRWLSERYPLINENITAEQIPEFDNLYLDMNGIIHTNSHNNTGGLCVTDEADVFVEAFKYITRLVHIIRPKKLLYMAVDGCAPRAKMNQQRSRRFRAADEARAARRRAEENGDPVSGTQFDSNCITPGTEFMDKLTEHLQFFICMKIQEDPLWRDITVVLSGPDVPGEGEHKVMDYVRCAKAQPGYSPNLRHCLYGLDADLIMLALASHEPNFALLREEVVFGKPVPEEMALRRLVTTKERFQLLHVSLVREYLDLEFAAVVARQPGFRYSLERVIDDLVLFCVLVGNDFLPCLPFAEIGDNGLDTFITVYKDHLKRAQGDGAPWLTYDCGRIAFPQLAKFLQRYAGYEAQKFEAEVDDGNFVLGAREMVGEEDAPEPENVLAVLPDVPQSVEEARQQYYDVKFGIDIETHEGTQAQRGVFQSYLEGLQWVMFYYFRGPGNASWGWFYPFYHAPMVADLVHFDELSSPKIEFEVGEPFRPFQQLMGVLPSNSKQLLPECYRWLFDSPESPILDFYPRKFQIDRDGVKVPWGGVTLIPFIETRRLLDAMARAESAGAVPEVVRARNAFGEARAFRYDPAVRLELVSPMPRRFQNLLACPVRDTVFRHPPLPPGLAHFPNDVPPGHDARSSGFPTLHSHPVTAAFNSGARVFQSNARGKSLFLSLQLTAPAMPPEAEIRRVLEAPWLRVAYPCAHRGAVAAVHTASASYFADGRTERRDAWGHDAAVQQLKDALWKRGVQVECGQAQGRGDDWKLALAEVRVAESTLVDGEGQRRYSFRAEPEMQLFSLLRHDEEDLRSQPARPSQPPAGAEVLCVDPSSEAFGETGRVVAWPEASFDLLSTRAERDALQHEIDGRIKRRQAELGWYNLADLSRRVNLDVNIVSQLLGSLMARCPDNMRQDIGMGLMCEPRNGGPALCLPCYSMRQGKTWLFSDVAAEALEDYHRKFPSVFSALRQRQAPTKGWAMDFELRHAFVNAHDLGYAAEKLIKYCSRCAWREVRLVPESYTALAPQAVLEVQAVVDGWRADVAARRSAHGVSVAGSSRLFSPAVPGLLPPDALLGAADIRVGQRGVYAKAYGIVPCGAKGTVVGVYGHGPGRLVELLLDEDSFSATGCGGRVPPMRGVHAPASFFMPLAPPSSVNGKAVECRAATAQKQNGSAEAVECRAATAQKQNGSAAAAPSADPARPKAAAQPSLAAAPAQQGASTYYGRQGTGRKASSPEAPPAEHQQPAKGGGRRGAPAELARNKMAASAPQGRSRADDGKRPAGGDDVDWEGAFHKLLALGPRRP